MADSASQSAVVCGCDDGKKCGRMCVCDTKLDGKTVIITGATSGIGKVSTEILSAKGAKVVMAVRNTELGETIAAEIEKSGKAAHKPSVMKLELGSMKSIREFAEAYKATGQPIHVLMNNAGVMVGPKRRTEDGFEIQFGVNHLGHFLLTNLLLDVVKKSAPSRVINVSSSAHAMGTISLEDPNYETDRPYKEWQAYGQSKLANILFTKSLAKRLVGSKVVAISLHPGVIETELQRNMGSFLNFVIFRMGGLFGFTKTQLEGTQTQIHAATCNLITEGSKYDGQFLDSCQIKEPKATGKDMTMAEKLWELSAKLVGIDYAPLQT